jgi:glutathionylspermidine synthase
MRRVRLAPRPNWQARLEETGFHWHTPDGQPYWDESAAWVFSLREIEEDIEAPTAEIEAICLDFVGRAMVDENILRRLHIPPAQWGLIVESWQRGDRNLYGRLDLAYDGSGPAKLLEYNADTPTSLLEASIAQWVWLEDGMKAGLLPQGCDQFNSLHEKLVTAFRELRGGAPYALHLSQAADSPEDVGTVDYLEDCAKQAGLATTRLAIDAIGLNSDGTFVDLDNRRIDNLFKLYPWEWMFREAFADALPKASTRFIEPPWKAILSNKGLLPLLWEAHPGHPNLLPAYFTDSPRAASLGENFVEKPLFSREGANVTLHRRGAEPVRTEGPYTAEPTIRQQIARLAEGEGGFAVIGSWLIASEPAGLGIREDSGPITRDTARFVPHVIEG